MILPLLVSLLPPSLLLPLMLLFDITNVVTDTPVSTENSETSGYYAETSKGIGYSDANQVTGNSEAIQAPRFTRASCTSEFTGSAEVTQGTESSKATHTIVLAEIDG